MLKTALLTLPFPVLSTILAISPSPKNYPDLSLLFTILALITGGIFLYFLAQSFRANKLVIRLDKEGFHQLGTSIPWSGIAAFRHTNSVTQSMSLKVYLDLTEQGRILCGLPTPTATSGSEIPGDITVRQDLVDVSVPDLVTLLEKYRIYYTQPLVDRVGIVAHQPEEVVPVRNSGAGN